MVDADQANIAIPNKMLDSWISQARTRKNDRDGPGVRRRELLPVWGTAEQVAESRSWYNPYWHYENEPETRAALDLICSGHFSRGDARVFDPLHRTPLDQGDFYLHLADMRSYSDAQDRIGELSRDPEEFSRKAVLNVAGSGTFLSDRTISQYASEIWGVTACPTV